MRKVKKENCIPILIMLIVGVLIFYYNKLTPLYADDYSYMYSFADGGKITSIKDIFPSMYSHYYTMNGRLVLHFIAQLLLMLGKDIANIVNSLAFVGLGLTVYALSYNSLKNIKSSSLLFIYFSIFMFTPNFGQSYLWVTGSSNYLYGPIIILLFLLPFRKCLNAIDKKLCVPKSIALAFLMFIFGIIAGNTNENNGVTVVFISLLYIIFRIVKFRNVQCWAVSGMLGSLLGCVFMLISPGTKIRLGGTNLSVIGTIKNAVINTGMLVSMFGILLIVLTLLIFYFLYEHLKICVKPCTKHEYIKSILFCNPLIVGSVLAFLVDYFSLSAAPGAPDRTMSTPLAFLIICILITYDLCDNVKIKKPFLRVLTISLAIVFLGTYFYGIFELKNVDAEYQNRITIINNSIENKETTVTLPAICSSSRYSCFDYNGDLNNNENSWQNMGIAKYFNLDKVYLEKN